MSRALWVLVAVCLLSTAAHAQAAPNPKCTYRVVAPYASLIAGAEADSQLWLESSTTPIPGAAAPGSDSCKDQLVGQHVTLKENQITLAARVLPGDGVCGCAAILDVTDPAPSQAVDPIAWQIADSDSKALGSVTFGVLKIALKQLVVAVNTHDQSTNKQVIRTPAADGTVIAAARHWVPVAHTFAPVDDIDQLDIPAALAVPSGPFTWTLTTASWGQSVLFQCGGRWQSASPTCTLDPSRILFLPQRPLGSPLDVTLELRHTAVASVLSRVHVQLASSAATASLPIPLTAVAKIHCTLKTLFGSDAVIERWVGAPIPIDRHAIADRTCSVILDYDFKHLTAAEQKLGSAAWEEITNRGDLQGVSITVTHGSATATSDYVVAPAQGLELPVPVPTATSTGSGGDDAADYVVTLKLKSTLGVTYIDGLTDSATDPVTNASFTLHTRSPGSTTWPVRIGVTFPVTPLSIRIPPRSDEVTSSSSSTRASIETQRASAMVFAELWDSAHDESYVPIQIQTGLSAFRSSGTEIGHLSWMLGGTLTFPIAGEDKTATSLSFGVFFEQGITEAGHAVVLTFSVDLFQPLKTSGIGNTTN